MNRAEVVLGELKVMDLKHLVVIKKVPAKQVFTIGFISCEVSLIFSPVTRTSNEGVKILQ